MTIRMATSALVLSVLFFWLRGVMAFAAPPPEPQPGTDFQATRAFVGDTMLGIEPADPGSLFNYLPDTALPMASVTKSFTLLLAVEAIMSGSVALDDVIIVSAHAATINNGHSGGHSVAGLTTGQVILFEDLLYGMMLPSGGDASIAIGEHVAGAAHPAFGGISPFLKHLVFVSMMNNRAASLGLEDTEFFNSYGGDHIHASDHTPGASVPHRATARDIARWFEVGLTYPLFREVAGFRGTYPGFGWTSGFSYPGLVAQKPGSNGSCTQCRGAAARRVGRELVGGFEDGAVGDMRPLLNYGYASLFHPTLEVESAPYTKGWAKQDLACVSSDRAASAVVRPDGTLRMLLWGVDVGAPSIQHLNPIQVAPWGIPGGGLKFRPPSEPRGLKLATHPPVQVAPVLPAYASRQGTPPPPPPPASGVIAVDPGPRGGGFDPAGDFDSGHETPLVTDARVSNAEDGHLVVAASTSQGVFLHAYAIFADNTIGLRDTQFLGVGDLGRVEALKSGIVVVGHRDDGGVLRLTSFRLDTATGLLTNPLDTVITSGIGEELEINAGRSKGTRQHFAVASVSGSGQRRLRSWEVNRLSGSISSKSSFSSATTASNLAFERVQGFGTREVHALAFRSGGQLRVESFEINPDGTIDFLASQSQADAFVSINASIRMAAYEDGGVMIAMQPTPWDDEIVLETWSFDPNSWSPSSTIDISTLFPNRIAQEVVAQAGVHALCRVPEDQAEGDFLLATGDPASEGITVQSWRSAPR